MAAVKKRKPETNFMGGAAERTLRSAYSQYLAWDKAVCEDMAQPPSEGDVSTFLDWAKDTLK